MDTKDAFKHDYQGVFILNSNKHLIYVQQSRLIINDLYRKLSVKKIKWTEVLCCTSSIVLLYKYVASLYIKQLRYITTNLNINKIHNKEKMCRLIEIALQCIGAATFEGWKIVQEKVLCCYNMEKKI